jgi:hypothetical protein
MRKNARASLAIVTAAGALLAALSSVGSPNASAFPLTTPSPGPSSSPTATPATKGLPFDSSLIFVLDDPITSNGSKPNDIVRVHLKNALVVEGKTIAAAGAPAKIRVLDAESAKSGDVYGYVNIFFLPLQLADGRELPLRAPTAHLTVNTTAGHEATVATEDTIGDIFIPYHVLYHAFRKGRNFVLSPGSEIRARTQANLSVLADGSVAIGTPQPISVEVEAPHSTFPTHPFATPKPGESPGSMTVPTLRPDIPNPGATPRA